jgi:hypothetical protein
VSGPLGAATLDGLIPLTIGTGLVIVKRAPVADPPPGGGFMTPIATSPGRLRKPLEITPSTRVEETKVVVIGVPPTVIWLPFRRFVPVTPIVTDALPAIAVAGLKPVIVGCGFSTLIENAAVPPPGLALEINPDRVVGFTSSDAVTSNVMVFPETVPLMPPNVALVDARNPLP